MTENLIIISLIGLVVGFLLSIPAAGPTTIVIITNALKGRTRYCNLVTIGASFADLVYVFISVYGLTKLYSLYKPYIPYVLLAGCLYVIYISFKISKTTIDLEIIDDTQMLPKNIAAKSENGLLTGIMLGFLNPSLFISCMTSSLIILTMLASFGFNTGGLDKNLSKQLMEIKNDVNKTQDTNTIPFSRFFGSDLSNKSAEIDTSNALPKSYPFLLSLFYAIFLSIGSIVWFYYLAFFISKFRDRINAKVVHRSIQALGVVLFFFGLVLGYKGISMLV